MTKNIIIIYLAIGFIISLIFNFGMDADMDKLKLKSQDYSYCVKKETSITIINLTFYYDGKDKSALTYLIDKDKDKNCSYYGLTTLRDGYPLWIDGDDYGCKLKNKIIEQCEEANKKAKD